MPVRATTRWTLWVSTALVLASAAGCTQDNPELVLTQSAGDAAVPAFDLAASAQGLPVGSACRMDGQCAGPGMPRCIDQIRPLAKLTMDPAIAAIGVDFPGGYCSTEPSCHSDAECGAGGTCFWPLQHVTAEVLKMIGTTINTDVTSFGQYGVCLRACKSAGDCRPGYVCDVPLKDLISLVPGATLDKTFCVGDPVCAACGAHASCKMVNNMSACVCDNGFMGDGKTCTPKCAMVCGANAHCDAMGACACDMGFSGDPVAGCVNATPCMPNPCQNNGQCTSSGPGLYMCTCPMGYEGTNCEKPIDGCAKNPCQNGGMCMMTGPGTYACTCAMGWNGNDCQTPIDACLMKPCLNGGTCKSTGPGTYSCACPFGYTGVNCETAIDACAMNPCLNGGKCMMAGPGLFTCNCAMGFTGMKCENMVNGCMQNPCVHGTCSTPMGGGYACKCDPGWMGVNCDALVNVCQMNPCMNGGMCTVTGPNTYSCMCAMGYNGNNCQNAINACAMNPCMNGGMCNMTGPGTYACMCAMGWSGNNCQTPVNACAMNPCMNGGACNMTGPGTYTCKCPNGFTGVNCETAVVYCDVVYRLDTAAPSAASQFRVANTGLGAMDTLNTVGVNAATPGVVTTPFTANAFPRGFMRLRFPSANNAPVAGPVALVEYLMPLELSSGAFGTTVTTNVDHSIGLLKTTNMGCPNANYDACLPAGNVQTLNRTCTSQGTGVLANTTLTWDTCSLAAPAPPGANPGNVTAWAVNTSQIAPANVAANPGCMSNMSSFGNVTCTGGFCGQVPNLGVQNTTWDQKFSTFTFSGTDYTKATIQMPQTTLPSPANVYDSIRWAAAVPIQVQCGVLAKLTCNIQ